MAGTWTSSPRVTRSPPLKVLQATILFLAVVAWLFFVVFPWIEPYLPYNT